MHLFRVFSIIVTLSLSAACVHSSTSTTKPLLYNFPTSFFVEQALQIKTPDSTRNLTAQLELKAQVFKLVLSDPMTSIVLAQVSFEKGLTPKVLYLHPAVKSSSPPLPLAAIADSIRELYERSQIPLLEERYSVTDGEKGWIYTWTTFGSDGSCLFPDDVDLRFKDKNYQISIGLKQLECPLKE